MPIADGGERVAGGHDRRPERHGPDGPDPGGHAGREGRPERDAEHRPDDADGHGLDEDVRGQLAARRAGRAQQAELADPLDDGHRERVEDQERAGEQRDGGDERGRRREVAGRGAHRRPPRSRGDDRTYGSASRVDSSASVTDAAGSCPSSRPMSMRVRPSAAKTVWAVSQRHDDGPAAGAGPRPVAGQDADDPQVDRRVDGPWTPIVEPTARPSSRASVALTSASSGPGVDQPAPGAERQVVERGLGVRVDAGDRDRRRQRVARREERRRRGTSAARRPGRRRPRRRSRRSCRAVASDRPVSPNAATRRSARPDERADRTVDGGVDAGVRGEAGEQHGDAERDAGRGEARAQRAGPEAAPGEAGRVRAS